MSENNRYFNVGCWGGGPGGVGVLFKVGPQWNQWEVNEVSSLKILSPDVARGAMPTPEAQYLFGSGGSQ